MYVGINTEHTLYCVATSSSGVGVRRWTTAYRVVGSPPALVLDACHHSSFMLRRLVGPV